MARRSNRSKIRTFTSKGTATSAGNRSLGVHQVGKIIPGTNKIYAPARAVLDRIAPGAGVKVVNQKASLAQSQRRTSSLGMGGVGQVGRSGDVGAKGE